MRNVASERTSPDPMMWPGTHALRGHAAYALRAYGGYVQSMPAPLKPSYGRLYDAVAEQMHAAGDAYNVSVKQLTVAYKRAKIERDGFLLRSDITKGYAAILSPAAAASFVGGLQQQAGLYNRNASQKVRDTSERNAIIRKRVLAYVRKDLACTSLPEPFVDALREEFQWYADWRVGKPLAAKRTECLKLLRAEGYTRVTTTVGPKYGTKKTWALFLKLCLARYGQQNDFLSVSDIIELARTSGHDMRVNAAQKETVEAAMRMLFRTSRNYEYQQYQQENRMRFQLEKSIVQGNKDTLHRDEIIDAMAAAELPREARKLCRVMLPNAELSAQHLGGTVKS